MNDSSSQWIGTYNVFLNYNCGETNTLLEFTEKLYASLKQKGIIVFTSSSKYSLHEIDQCLGCIVVLSRNFASSGRSLDELQKIIESKRISRSEVFPVFYGVSPSSVRYQIDNFAKAFEILEEEEEEEEKVQNWRCSLKEVAGISGWESKNYEHNEAELIEDIVESVWNKLHPKIAPYEGLLEIHSRIEKMDSLLSIESWDEVGFVGIWGMGGIGKTSLAKTMFSKIRDKFEISCFIENVSEICGQKGDMFSLQRTLVSHLKIKGLKIEDDVEQGKNKIKEFLFNKKVLLVLDDINEMNQLRILPENQEKWFGLGSRIIITTRDKQILISYGIVQIYQVGFLNLEESLQFLQEKAMKINDHNIEEINFMELSNFVVQYAKGLPMALEMYYSFLCGKNIIQWEEVLDKIKEEQSYDIVMKSLRRSYDGLDVHYKNLFLDIACFFKGWEKEILTQILQICGRYRGFGIEVLIEKSLVTFDGLRVEMHDLLQQMGRNIVFEECPMDASNRSRLWSIEHINEVLLSSKESKTIQGIVLNSTTEPLEAIWDPESLSKMLNLKILIINIHNMKLPLGLKSLCSSLKVLHWKEYPLEALPLGLQLDEIVDLKMHHSKIKKIWKAPQPFAKLKFIDLSFSKDLIQTPIVSGVPCLAILLLEGCTKLVEVHKSIGNHKKLVKLNLKNCTNLQTLPRKLEMDSLEELVLSGCSRIKKLPAFGKNMEILSLLSLEDCRNLTHLPNSICNLKSLRRLNINGCSRLSWLPNNMNENSLEEVYLRGTSITEITSSRIHFKGASESTEQVQWFSWFRKQARVKIISCSLL